MRLRVIEGDREGGPAGSCVNHQDVQATYRVAVPGFGATEIWMLCSRCANDMLANIEGAIAAPVRRRNRGRTH